MQKVSGNLFRAIGNYLKRADKQRLILYLLSFAIYKYVNISFSETALRLFGEDEFRLRWTSRSIPCGGAPHAFVISFQLFKLALTFLLYHLSKRNVRSMVCEAITAYFMYDVIYVLAFIYAFIPLPFQFQAMWMLISSGQIFLGQYFRYLDVIAAAIWSLILLALLGSRRNLSLTFLAVRLALIVVSVPLVSRIIYHLKTY